MTETEDAESSSYWQRQTALVTGSTRGLGRTIAEHLAERGARIVVTGRQEADVETAVRELSAHGSGHIGFTADLSDHRQTHELAKRALQAVGEISILVNNAGMSLRGNFWEVTDAKWDEQVNVNYRAPFILAQYVAKRMIDHGTRGRIINVGTIGARKCHRDGAVYDSAKGGVEVMTRNMAYELGPYGISVNCVVPGAIPIRPGGTFDPERAQQYLRFMPLGRFGAAEDIAAAVVFYCSAESAFTTGQSLLVDGGHATYLSKS